ncbi:hypothetical protein [Gloeothece verrucosa]|uniref:Uncharacterized protein n=1 Tax=Gloeothece verrucosa (strain PCC 7822) TaxID=497965 RepID=E0U543_GLOV7|nr:hypothetical protein [Gloeothece verrucosa]ADN12322.1 conserved hypothetical protein [Gloeothece verrucosa PCC 7822]
MTEPTQDITLAQATILLIRYGFDLKGYFPQELIDKWLKDYSAKWIRTAIIEALYQGRYKAISVEQILKLWRRREQMTSHFSHEFERLICRNLLEQEESGEYAKSHDHPPQNTATKTLSKSFNPAVIPEQNRIFSPHSHQPPFYPLTAVRNSFPTPINEATDEDLNHPLVSNSSDENLSVYEAAQSHLRSNSQASPLSLLNHEGLPTSDTKVNNSQDLKSALTNLDELFTQFFTETDPQKSASSAFYTDLDHDYQWRGTIAGRTIDEFTPKLDRSELYSKLKAVVQQQLEEKTQVNR